MADERSRPAEVTSALPASPRDECLGLAQVIDRVGDKWTVMVVGHLSQHSHLRFNALMRAVPGVSHRMLTLTLRGLEREGLVSRTAYATIPPRVDYALTPLGRSLTEPLASLAVWASRHRREIEAARHAYDHRATAADEVAGQNPDGPTGPCTTPLVGPAPAGVEESEIPSPRSAPRTNVGPAPARRLSAGSPIPH